MKKKILFVYDHEYPHLWRDGLWAAIQLLLNDYDVVCKNIRTDEVDIQGYDFLLGWGGFESPVEQAIRCLDIKKGLCIGGNAFEPIHRHNYDVLFYETKWYKPQIADHKNIHLAFGVNTQIYFHRKKATKLFDVISVGAFSSWKRQEKIRALPGLRIVIGEIQRGNMSESLHIVGELLTNGVAVCNMVTPEKLSDFYNASRLCYIPADINGGGERAVLEARACGVPVKIEGDNPKLNEMSKVPVPSEVHYYKALLRGITSVI